jgi:hypothetical protein
MRHAKPARLLIPGKNSARSVAGAQVLACSARRAARGGQVASLSSLNFFGAVASDARSFTLSVVSIVVAGRMVRAAAVAPHLRLVAR